MPLYTKPICLCAHHPSYKMDFCSFSVADTTSFTALILTEGAPPATVAEAYTIWTNLPDRLNIVKEEP